MSDSLNDCTKCLRPECQCEKENGQAQSMHQIKDEMARANVNQDNRTQESNDSNLK